MTTTYSSQGHATGRKEWNIKIIELRISLKK